VDFHEGHGTVRESENGRCTAQHVRINTAGHGNGTGAAWHV
jgi:hypothetical protein